MSKEKEKESRKNKDGLWERDRAYKETYRATRCHKSAVRSYCAGNKWLTENAKATGNW